MTALPTDPRHAKPFRHKHLTDFSGLVALDFDRAIANRPTRPTGSPEFPGEFLNQRCTDLRLEIIHYDHGLSSTVSSLLSKNDPPALCWLVGDDRWPGLFGTGGQIHDGETSEGLVETGLGCVRFDAGFLGSHAFRDDQIP
jgi:hypothetical protein